jgi:hypothetical protein
MVFFFFVGSLDYLMEYKITLSRIQAANLVSDFCQSLVFFMHFHFTVLQNYIAIKYFCAITLVCP